MKKLLLLSVISLAGCLLGSCPEVKAQEPTIHLQFDELYLQEENLSPDPEFLVQQQLDAYNTGNINAFLEPYSEEVEFYQFPNQLLGKGKEIMRQQYQALFDHYPNLHCDIKERIVNGNIVIDHERISGMGPSGNKDAIVIFII